ncbi:Tol-pal system protein TolB [Chitinispirillum alkaliphilum]|nr:Tol-pal system protein TolB [Chitinispirillum alkaliphilum]
MKKLILLFLIFPFWISAQQRFDLEVYASRFDSIPIGVVGFESTNDIQVAQNAPWEVIASNLDFSGRFSVVSSEEYDSALFIDSGIGIYIDGKYTVEGDSITIECYLRDVETRSLIIGKKYSGEKRFLRNMAHRYSNEIVEMLFGDRGIFESKILFVRTEGARRNIAVMDFDGHNQKQLTNTNVINIFPKFEGKNGVIWTSYQRGKPDLFRGSIAKGTHEIFIYNRAMQVSPAISRIDGMIAFACSRRGNLDIYVCEPDGSNLRQLTFHRGIDTSPTWSPNGFRMAFTSDRAGGPQIYVMDADGANQKRITFESRYADAPAWSPRGDRIAYVSMGQSGKFDIWTVSPDGSDPFQVTDLPGSNEYPTWSPDGSLIAFTNIRGDRSDLYVVRPDGTRLRRVTSTGDVRMPDWSDF